MEQHKNKKGSHKDFSRWMVNEIEDFFPEIAYEDPLEKLSYLLDKNHSSSLPNDKRKKLVIARRAKTLKHGPNFQICEYWRKFSSQITESVAKFLNVKDVAMMMYTCKYFKEEFDQESVWRTLKVRDFFPLRLQMLLDNAKDRVSEKLYYKYLYLSIISGIPYHTGYFKAYGSLGVVKLSESIVDFLCPKTEVIKNYLGEILVRNQCKIFDLKLSWLKEKNEICLWNGNASLDYKEPEKGNEGVETVKKFYPCFFESYSMVNEDEEIVETFFLEDKYLVVKLQKKEIETEKVLSTIFRVLNLEEELYSIAKGLESALPFDYSFVFKDDGDGLADIVKVDKFGVDFCMCQSEECDVKMKLLLDDTAVFYAENSLKPTLIFWDLKEKKKIDSVSVELQKPLESILVSKKSNLTSEKLKLILLDASMNVYCGSLSEKDGFVLNQSIILPSLIEENVQETQEETEEEQEENKKKLKELEAKFFLNIGKKVRCKYRASRYPEYLPADSFYDVKKEPLPEFNEKNRRYYQEICNKTNEEWLVVNMKNNLHFINLEEGKIHQFKDAGLLACGNWTIYEDNLIIASPENIFYYKVNFEDRSIRFRFSRETKSLCSEKIGTQWIAIDPCFTVLVLTHMFKSEFTQKVTIIVTSTQEFLYNQDPAFNNIIYKIQAESFLCATYRLERNDRDLNIKFENSKVLVSTDRASFYFDMNLSAEPYNKVHLNGWMSNTPIHIFGGTRPVAAVKAREKVAVEEKEIKPPKQKMVNHMKLEGNPNTMNAKEKNNGWKKEGKSQVKREEDQEYKVLKGKGEKYHKNIRQGQRSAKVH